MSLSDLASLGSFVSGLAVLATLAFLVVQLRQTNRNQRALMQQSRTSRTSDVMMKVTEPHIIGCMTRGGAGDIGLSQIEIETFNRVVTAMFLNWEDTYLQNLAGTIDVQSFDADEANMEVFLALPGYRAAWTTNRRLFSGAFRAHVDRLTQRLKASPPRRDMASAWKAHAAEETVAPAARNDSAS